jgi:integrase
MAQDLIVKNPCDYTKPPKRVKSEINALCKEERVRMMELVRNAPLTPLGLAIELALTTGMRRGELCALRWSDLSNNGILHVRRALGNAEGGFYEKEPKTSSSRRTIPLTNQTFELLMDYKNGFTRTAEAFGIPFGDPYILGTPGVDSRPYNPSIFSKEFTTFAKMNGFDCTLHDLRHTFATFMIAGGVDVATVASYLGHSSVSMTLNVYAAVDPDAKAAVVSKVEEALGL